MKPSGPFVPIARRGRGGWHIFVDELIAQTRIGIHAHEHVAPQPIVVDARLAYRCVPSEEGGHAWIDYARYCERVTLFVHETPYAPARDVGRRARGPVVSGGGPRSMR